MLHHLRVANLGVLEDVTIDPGPGFTAITGETGAGKTMLLGALRLLTGEKSKSNGVGPFGEEALAEGLFSADDTEIGVTRVVPRSARSRAYLDGNLASTAALVGRIGPLVEIVGQHDRLLLQRSQTVLDLVDGTLDRRGQSARAAYADAWARYRSALDDQRRLGGDRMALERELDLLRYQSDEIGSAGLTAGDDLRIESMAARLRNAEAMREHLMAAAEELERMGGGAGEVVSRLRKLAVIDDTITDHVSTAEGLESQVHDLLLEVRSLAEVADDDPRSLEALEERLTALGVLKRKYGKTLDEVLEFGSDASRRVSELELLIGKASNIDEMLDQSQDELDELGAQLGSLRRDAAGGVQEQAQAHLADLGLPAAAVEISFRTVEPGSSGIDEVEIRFASDNRLASGPIQEVASGGELSRLMLALHLATQAGGADTMVFDEIDAGVGGATALALGRKLAELADTCQVLCVTHLPQVAAHAQTHFVIDRDGPRAALRKVEGKERLTELSRMLAGLPESERGREAAAELLQGALIR